MELPIFNSNKRQLLLEAALLFFIVSLIACSPEKSASTSTNSSENKTNQQIDVFQAPQFQNQSNQAVTAADLKIVGILITASGDNSAVISIGVSGQASTYRVGDEVTLGIKIISISSEEVVVSDQGNNFRIAMTRAIKNEQSSLGTLSQSDPAAKTFATDLPAGMIPMSPNADTRPSANNEFREIINQRFQK